MGFENVGRAGGAATPGSRLAARASRAGVAGDRARRGHPAARADARGGAVRVVARSRMADRGSRAAVLRPHAAARAAVHAPRAARSRRRGAARPAAPRHAGPFDKLRAGNLCPAAGAADAHARRARAADARAPRPGGAPGRRGDRSRHDRHRSDAGPRGAAHALHARAADARAALDAPRPARRADGAGPLRRARSGRHVPSRRVHDDAVCDRT